MNCTALCFITTQPYSFGIVLNANFPFLSSCFIPSMYSTKMLKFYKPFTLLLFMFFGLCFSMMYDNPPIHGEKDKNIDLNKEPSPETINQSTVAPITTSKSHPEASQAKDERLTRTRKR